MSATSTMTTPDLATFEALASLGNSDFGPSGVNLFLPCGWSLLAVAQNSYGTQAYLTQGAQPSTGKTVAVLALGWLWGPMMNWYDPTFHYLYPLFPYLLSGPAPTGAAKAQRDPGALHEAIQGLLRVPHIHTAALARAPALAAAQRQKLRSAAKRLGEALADRGPHAGGTAVIQALVESCGGAIASLDALQTRAQPHALHAAGYEGFFTSRATAAHNAIRATAAVRPSGLAASSGITGQFDFGYQTFYGYLRGALWAKLSMVAQQDLIVVGHGQAAPLAQLAALDLLPTKPHTTSPVKSVGVAVFSAPAFCDQDFQASFPLQVPNAYSGYAQSATGSPVDYFPSAPTATQGWYPPIAPQPIQAQLPTWDDPWYERSGEYYSAQLPDVCATAVSRPAPARAAIAEEDAAAFQRLVAEASAPVAVGYSGDLAYALAQLSALAYQRYQHPDLPFTRPLPSPWTFAADVKTADGVTFASVFQNSQQVAVAFRGTVSWEELFSLQGNANLVAPSYLPSGVGSIAQGMSGLYASLRSNLFAALKAVPGISGLALYLTGHSMGGALATLCLLDLGAPQSGIPAPTALYTFGAPPVGDYGFQAYFAASPLSACAFRVVRDYDIMPNVNYQLALAQAPVAVAQYVHGSTPMDGTTSHPISSYLQLMDPSQ